MDVISKEVLRPELTPARSQREAHADEGKTHNHVPGADIGDRVLGLGDVEDDDPEEADKEGSNHRRSKPARAFKLKRIGLGHKEVRTVIFLLLADARLWHGGRLHQSSR